MVRTIKSLSEWILYSDVIVYVFINFKIKKNILFIEKNPYGQEVILEKKHNILS